MPYLCYNYINVTMVFHCLYEKKKGINIVIARSAIANICSTKGCVPINE